MRGKEDGIVSTTNIEHRGGHRLTDILFRVNEFHVENVRFILDWYRVKRAITSIVNLCLCI